MIQQLGITITNTSNGRSLRLDDMLEGINISTVVPGGFGTFTFQFSEAASRRFTVPIQELYACDVIVTDPSGRSLFEGQLTDVKLHSDASDSYFECEATGWQLLLDEPFKGLFVERDLPWTVGNIAYQPSAQYQNLIPLTIGQIDATDATKVGIAFNVQSGVNIGTFILMSAQFLFPIGTRINRIMYDSTFDTNHTLQMTTSMYGITDAGLLSGGTTLNTPGGPTSYSGNVTGPFAVDGCRGVYVLTQVTTGGTASANLYTNMSNIRVLGTRYGLQGSTGTAEPVYGHEIVATVLQASLLPTSYSGIESDTSFQFPAFSYLTSEVGRAVLDAVTAYYSKYWAVWEGKSFYWKSWNPSIGADWVVSRDNGAQIDIDPSIVNAARVVRVRYTDPAGIAVETDITDPNQDNIYRLAGATKTAIVDLGITTTAAAATQVGATFFPDHSYEVVGGTITMPAQAMCASQQYGSLLPAYRIRAGDTVRIRDASSVRSIFNDTSWNRSTLFRITATDLDWENQTIKLTIDNSQASLDQIMARTQTSLSAKYGI